VTPDAVDTVADSVRDALQREVAQIVDGDRIVDPARFHAIRADVQAGAVADAGADAADLVEALLGVEYRLEDGQFERTGGKADRNRQGAYYTPETLARACCRRAVDRLIEQRLGIETWSRLSEPDRQPRAAAVGDLLGSITVADLSSGTGRFLGAWIDYLRAWVCPLLPDGGALVRRALTHVLAVDIDPLALLATRWRLAAYGGGLETVRALEDRCILGNPLWATTAPAGEEARQEAWRTGRPNDPRLAIDRADPRLQNLDLILGNPPWERIRLEERSFFSRLDPGVSAHTRKDARQRAIAALEEAAPTLFGHFRESVADVDAYRQAIRQDPRLVDAASGELNTYTLFTALAVAHLAPNGVVGLLVKSALCTTPVHRGLFRSLLDGGRLVEVHDFINTAKIFPIDSRERFAWVVLGSGSPGQLAFRAGLTRPEQLDDDADLLPLDAALLDRLNPLTGMVPSIQRADQLQLLLDLDDLAEPFDSQWSPRFGRIVHLTAHAKHLRKAPGPDRLPVYEGKFLGPYDGRARTFAGVPDARRYVGKAKAKAVPDSDREDPDFRPEVRWYLQREAWEHMTRRYAERWSLVWRNTTSASNTQPCIATILPHQPTIQSVQLLQLAGSPPKDLAVLLAVLNSIVVEALLRLKLNGIDLTSKVVRQLPVPGAERWTERVRFKELVAPRGVHVARRVASLLANDSRMTPFAADLGVTDPVPADQRARVQDELDVLVASAYSLDAGGLARLCRVVPPARSPAQVSWLTDPAQWPELVR
jgi:hypothetical protein